MNARNGLLSALLAGLIGSSLHAGDWPRFRGPGGSGVSDETGLPIKWSKTEGFRWKIDLPGSGLSSPVIIGDRLYLTACTGWEQKRLHVLCYDARTGRTKYSERLGSGGAGFTSSGVAIMTFSASMMRVIRFMIFLNLTALSMQS